jgi:hypothetical protein
MASRPRGTLLCFPVLELLIYRLNAHAQCVALCARKSRYLPFISSGVHSSIHSSTVLHPFVGPWPLFQFHNPIHNRQDFWPGGGVIPSQDLSLHTGQHKHSINAKRRPCLEWDSNPRPQHSSGENSSCRRPHGQRDQQFWGS